LNSFKAIFLYFSKNNLGVHIAHMGVAVFLVGVTGEQFYKTEFNIKKNIGDIINIGNKSLIFDKVETLAGPNYKSETATFTLLKDQKKIDVLKPEKRFYPIEKSQTTEAAILSDFWGDTYLVLGDGNKETGWSIRVYFNPLISWIWGGAGFMALGGLVSIVQSRKSRKKFKNAI
jgi:cytochrome c-type biogenesis protein CcmF